MRGRLYALAGLATLTGGCGGSTEEAFNREFDKNFAASCTSSAVAGGIPEAAATEACNCALEGINEKFSMTEKMTMSGEEAQPIMAECVSKVVQQ
jgi:hypothetical protein